MAAEGDCIYFMFLGPPYPAAGSATVFTVPELGSYGSFPIPISYLSNFPSEFILQFNVKSVDDR